MNARTLWLLARCCAIGFVAMAATAGNSSAAVAERGPQHSAVPQQDPRVGSAVWEALSRASSTRILLVFSVPADPTGPASATERGHGAIVAAAQKLLDQLPPGEFEVKRRFQTVPALAGEITSAGLLALLTQQAVVRVDPDLGGAGHLLQAVPIVQLDAVQALGFTGLGVTTAVIDSGIDTNHADLVGDLIAEQCFCSGGGGCCPNGMATQSGSGSAEDDHGHGTNVSGIISSDGGIAPLGGAPDAGVVAVKVLDSGGSFCCSSDVIAALDWVRINRPDVSLINLSLGTSALYSGVCDSADANAMAYSAAINSLRANGVTVFASSGNQGSGTQMSLPACIANAISVGAVWDANLGSQTFLGCTDTTTAVDKVTCFSNSNSTTDLFAPGAYTASTGMGGGVSSFGGTSQASPLVAACAAALLEAYPFLSPVELERILKNTPTMVTDSTNGLSFPRLDCLAALNFVEIFADGFQSGNTSAWSLTVP